MLSFETLQRLRELHLSSIVGTEARGFMETKGREIQLFLCICNIVYLFVKEDISPFCDYQRYLTEVPGFNRRLDVIIEVCWVITRNNIKSRAECAKNPGNWAAKREGGGSVSGNNVSANHNRGFSPIPPASCPSWLQGRQQN